MSLSKKGRITPVSGLMQSRPLLTASNTKGLRRSVVYVDGRNSPKMGYHTSISPGSFIAVRTLFAISSGMVRSKRFSRSGVFPRHMIISDQTWARMHSSFCMPCFIHRIVSDITWQTNITCPGRKGKREKHNLHYIRIAVFYPCFLEEYA